MKRFKFTTIFAVIFLLLTVSFAGASLITFDTDPNGNTPNDDTDLTSPYCVDGLQVSFGFYLSGVDGSLSNAVFEKTGGDSSQNSGFWNEQGYSGTRYDTADPGYQQKLGDYFLRQPTGYSDFGTFRIQYSRANGSSTALPTAASGEIWDIDGTSSFRSEQYIVTAYGSSGNTNVLASLTSPLGEDQTLDGRPWVFKFTDLAGGIDHIDIDFIGSKTSGIGLAFKNYSPTSAVPIPNAVWLLGSGLLGLLCIRRKKS